MSSRKTRISNFILNSLDSVFLYQLTAVQQGACRSERHSVYNVFAKWFYSSLHIWWRKNPTPLYKTFHKLFVSFVVLGCCLDRVRYLLTGLLTHLILLTLLHAILWLVLLHRRLLVLRVLVSWLKEFASHVRRESIVAVSAVRFHVHFYDLRPEYLFIVVFCCPTTNDSQSPKWALV